MDIMFDTNAFDYLKENLEVITNSQYENNYYMTYVQEKELKKMALKKENKLEEIFESVKKIDVKKEPVSVFLVGHTPLGQGRVGPGKVYDELLNDSKNNVEDAIIGEAAISYGHSLVTDDKQLYRKVEKYNINVMTFKEFLEML